MTEPVTARGTTHETTPCSTTMRLLFLINQSVIIDWFWSLSFWTLYRKHWHIITFLKSLLQIAFNIWSCASGHLMIFVSNVHSPFSFVVVARQKSWMQLNFLHSASSCALCWTLCCVLLPETRWWKMWDSTKTITVSHNLKPTTISWKVLKL